MKILARFSRQMRKKGFYPNGLGGGQKNGKINLVEIDLKTDQILNLEKARTLIVDATNNLYNLINSYEKYKDYFETFPISINILHITIIGNKTQNQNFHNFIEFAILSKGMIYYKIDNENSSSPPLILIHKETFEEAKNILQESYLKSMLLQSI